MFFCYLCWKYTSLSYEYSSTNVKTQPQQSQVCRETFYIPQQWRVPILPGSPWTIICFLLRSLSSRELVTTRPAHKPVTMPAQRDAGDLLNEKTRKNQREQSFLSISTSNTYEVPEKSGKAFRVKNFRRQANRKREGENRLTRESG